MSERLLEVDKLKTVFHQHEGTVRAVDDASFYINKGEIIGIVGESGSGKSVSMMSILKLIQMPPGEIASGKVIFEGKDILKYPERSKEMRKIRGGKISIIFQEPMTSLNPVLKVGKQIQESIILHLGYSKSKAREYAIELLNRVGIPDAKTRIDYYPTQFSGGMRQRVMIAMAMSTNPEVLIADEATTALDVTTQEQILELLRDIVKEKNTSLIIITHDLSVIARYAERIYVMYSGKIVESAISEELFNNPGHPYTTGLLNAIPRLDGDKKQKLIPVPGLPPNVFEKDDRCPFLNRCSYANEKCKKEKAPKMFKIDKNHYCACYVRAEDRKAIAAKKTEDTVKIENMVDKDKKILEIKDLQKYYPIYKGIAHRKIADVRALDDVSFSIYKGETVGLVGESGCGKTTLAKSILRLHDVTNGDIYYKDKKITNLKERKIKDVRKNVQFIFQDPFGSLDPRQTAGNIVGESLKAHKITKTKEEYSKRIDELFVSVGLDPSLKNRVPHQFSGGQRQRIAIASALASEPSFIICDEPISALDVSIQAQIINLLIDIKQKKGLTYLFIAHDLSVVRYISDRIVVMYLGSIMEISPWDELYENPLHPYTKTLLSAIPIPDPVVEKNRKRVEVKGEVPSLINRPNGCVFHPRCPYATDICRKEKPKLKDYNNGHKTACFHVEKIIGGK